MKTKLIEQLADSPKRVRIIFRAALIILLTAGCYNWMIQPQTCLLFAAQQRSRWDTQKSAQAEKIRWSIQAFKKKISELEAQSVEAQKVLFEPNAVRDFFCSLETLAGESGCRIESLTFVDAESRPGQNQPQDAIVQPIQASVVIIGNYNTFIKFFERTSQFPQKITIHELRFEPITQGKSLLRCNVTIMVYVSDKSAASKH